MPGSIVRKSFLLTSLLAACLWFVLRDVGSIPLAELEDLQGDAALYQLDADEAIEMLSRTIDQQTAEGQSAGQLAHTYRLRGSYRLQQHEPQLALADFDEALRLNPGESVARFGQAEACRQLGDFDRAAEIQQTEVLELTDAFPGTKVFAQWVASLISLLSTATGAWLLVAAAWALLTIINAAVGWEATREVSVQRPR